MKYIISPVFLCLLLINDVAAQTTGDTSISHLEGAASGSANQTKDGTTYLFNNLAQYRLHKKDISFNARAAWVYGKSPEKLTNNDFSTGADFNLYKKFPNFYYWGLMNYSTSYSLNIRSQLQTGLGVAYQLVDRNGFKLNLSDGILFENSSIIDENDSNVVYQTFRNSLRVQFGYNYNRQVMFYTMAFWQPSLQFPNDHIVTTNTSLEVKIWKWFSLTSRLQYNLVTRTGKENLLFTYGIKAAYDF